jgi:hypothetical protein
MTSKLKSLDEQTSYITELEIKFNLIEKNYDDYVKNNEINKIDSQKENEYLQKVIVSNEARIKELQTINNSVSQNTVTKGEYELIYNQLESTKEN